MWIVQPLELPVADVEDDRHRAVVDELDLHPRAEDAGLDGDSQMTERAAEAFVDRLRLLRTSRARERGAVSPRGVGDERELADDEGGAAGVHQRAVELAVVALEDAQPRNLARQPFRLLGGIPGGHAEQDDEPAPDRAARSRPRSSDTLHDRTHKSQL